MAALLKRVFIFIALMLTTASGAWAADNVLYAEVSGTAMTLKYGAKPDGAYEFNGTQDWATFRGNITTATVEASCKAYDGWTLSNLFYGFAKLTTINDLTNLNTEQVNDMNLMFSYCIALTSLNLSAFNTAKVTNMYSMFEGCSALTAITVGNGWSTSKVTESSSMFKDCTSLPGYDASKTDKTNAHTGEGGYLTAAAPAGPTTYSVTLADGTEDAANWQAQVGDGEFTVLPVTGLEGGETVTIQYNGTRRIKSITAVQEAAAEEQQEEAVTAATPLTMKCLSDGTIKVDMDGGEVTLETGMQYAVNGGAKTKITETTTIEGLTTGDKVQFYGVGTSTTAYGDDALVKIAGGTAQVKVYGNIMSLVDETGFATKTDLPSSDYVFYGLFKGNANLTDASGLLLPATTLASNCYNGMFYGCTALTAAPELPAKTLAEQCYAQMFYGCTSLTAAPELPAKTLVNYCYYSMFTGCSKLATVTCKATDISASYCLNSWLNNAGTQATSPTLYVDPSMKENTGWKNGAFTVKAITAGGSEPVAATYTMAADAAAGDVGKLICTDGHIHAYNADADCTKSRVAMIAYVGNASDCTNGLAIALADLSTNTLTWNNEGPENGDKTAAELCSAWNTSKTVTDGSWRLPSAKDWQYMLIGCGSGESYSEPSSGMARSYSGLASKLSTAGGTALKLRSYWSSTEHNPSNAWVLTFNSSGANFYNVTKDGDYPVRACLAF